MSDSRDHSLSFSEEEMQALGLTSRFAGCSYDRVSGKEFTTSYGVDFPSDTGHPKLDAAGEALSVDFPYQVWMPDARTFTPNDPYTAWFLLIKLIDSVFLRWCVFSCALPYSLSLFLLIRSEIYFRFRFRFSQ